MRRIETAIIGILLGTVPVTVCFLAGWWASLPFTDESHVFKWAMAGIAVGLFIDAVFLRPWIRRAYSMPPLVLMSLYVFYSIGVFGFFMGVPVFNLLLSLPAGFFIGGRLAHDNTGTAGRGRTAHHCAIFTTCVMTVICIVSASIALYSPSTPADLGGMLSLPFQVTREMIISLILAGGTLILLLQWLLTLWSVKRAYLYLAGHAV